MSEKSNLVGKRRKLYYLWASFFCSVGILFIGTGLWGVGDSLTKNVSIVDDIIAFFFLSLFAAVAIAYGLFIYRDARSGPDRSIFIRLRPTRIIGLLIFGLAPVLLVYVNADMRRFALRRDAAFRQIRPALMRYIADHDKAPRSLNRLVPDYISEIPDVLESREGLFSLSQVRYAAMGKNARFYYRTSWRPDSKTYYDILDDRHSDK